MKYIFPIFSTIQPVSSRLYKKPEYKQQLENHYTVSNIAESLETDWISPWFSELQRKVECKTEPSLNFKHFENSVPLILQGSALQIMFSCRFSHPNFKRSGCKVMIWGVLATETWLTRTVQTFTAVKIKKPWEKSQSCHTLDPI